jgi:hypothetical protein
MNARRPEQGGVWMHCPWRRQPEAPGPERARSTDSAGRVPIFASQLSRPILASQLWDAKLPEVFDRADLVQLLGFEPRRSTLHPVLLRYVRERALGVEEGPGGRYLTRYRKLQAPS